jgi:ceramide glucosyltransferase
LTRIGGFQSVANQLADDYAIGSAVRRAGLGVVVPPMLVAHSFEENSLSDVIRHELRWARTIFTVNPLGYVGSSVTHALPLAVVGAALRRFDGWGLAAVLGALTCRLVLKYRLARELKLPDPGYALLFLETCSRSPFISEVSCPHASTGADRISQSHGMERCWRGLSRQSARRLMEGQ